MQRRVQISCAKDLLLSLTTSNSGPQVRGGIQMDQAGTGSTATWDIISFEESILSVLRTMASDLDLVIFIPAANCCMRAPSPENLFQVLSINRQNRIWTKQSPGEDPCRLKTPPSIPQGWTSDPTFWEQSSDHQLDSALYHPCCVLGL
ncbi:hypothetical protein XENOCAPTIV_003775 [Xenoophorus captivus]|uniref:Uncharacterized protein n=1 Tax=Xenoophorus captivus TaxID=1517983 RepID=A0ABV0Q8S0_9TELE